MTIHNFGISNESPSMVECTIEMQAKCYFSKSNFIRCSSVLFRFVAFRFVPFGLDRIESNCNKYWVWLLRGTDDAYSDSAGNTVSIKRYIRIIQMSYYLVGLVFFPLSNTCNGTTNKRFGFSIHFYQSHNWHISSSYLRNQ